MCMFGVCDVWSGREYVWLYVHVCAGVVYVGCVICTDGVCERLLVHVCACVIFMGGGWFPPGSELTVFIIVSKKVCDHF